MPAVKPEHVKVAERLQTKLLTNLEKKLDDGTISAAEITTLEKLLSKNGWSLDPAQVPQGIADKLTPGINPLEFIEGDPDLPRSH